ncbi:MAG TPA: ribosomal protein S18-alanine N-acetyltransferase [Leptolyngbyaceae cyanobacterium M65_K2018_010]|nr:ribosomal protein S18-alanine N-acetyltransferase [Leptolyngbyaceae cyanobacterium M65_K2018_010]
MGELFCRAPGLADVPALVELDRRSLGGLWSETGYRREIESPNSCLRVLSQPNQDSGSHPSAAQMTGMEIIGLGCYWAILDEAHITVLGVDPRYQRRGLGQWLLVQLLVAACQQGLKRATLEVRASNQVALNLYESFGFEPLGNRKAYYPDGEDALILWQNSLKNSTFQENLRIRRIASANRLRQQGWQILDEKDVANRT